MINGLGILGWGVGGIEAEAAMLGQPLSMLIPEVVGFRLHGKLPAGATATDLVLTVTQILRKKKVVGKFVEFYGSGLSSLSLADRATIANMAPEYGATVGFFPVDAETLKYLRLSGRNEHQVRLVEEYSRAQGMFREDDTPDPEFTDSVSLRPRQPSSPALPGPSARRIACRCPTRRRRSTRRGAPRWSASARSPARSRWKGDGRERADAALAGGGRDGSRRGDGEERQRERDVQRAAVRAQARRGGDRRDHELHEHVEPERDARRGAARAEGRRARAQDEAVGEDEPARRARRWSRTTTRRPA